MKTLKATIKQSNIQKEKLERKAYYPAVFLMSMLFANAQILGSIAPFSLALIAGLPQGLCLTAFLGSVIGYVCFGGMVHNLSYMIALIAVLTIKIFSSAFKRLSKSILFNCIMCGAVSLITGMLWVLTLNRTVANIALTIAESFMAGAMTYFCATAYKVVRTKKSLITLKQTEISSILIVLSVMLLSLYGLDTGYFNVGRVLGILLTLALIQSKGVVGGVTGGIITAVCSVVYNNTLFTSAAIVVLAAFFAGLMKPLGKISQIAMFVVASTAFSIVSGADETVVFQMLDVFLATVIFAVIPNSILSKIALFSVETEKRAKITVEAVNKSVAAKLSIASGAIDDLSHSVKKVSKRMESISAQNIATVYTRTADTVCVKCGYRLLCWEDAYNDTMKALNSFTKLLRTNGEVTTADMPFELKSRCCKPTQLIASINKNYNTFVNKEKLSRRISESRSIAIEQFDGIADMLGEISSELSEVVKYDEKSKLKVKKILDELGVSAYEVCCSEDKYNRMCVDIYCYENSCSNEIIADKLSDVLGREFELPSVVIAGDKTKLSFFEKAVYSIEYYAAQSAYNKNGVCGDSYEFFVDAKGYAHLILSDGMGCGNRAAVDSVMTCSLILKLIKSGFGLESALKLINASMIVKSDDESLATLDIAKFDLYMGTVSLYKAGAATTFIKRGDDAFRIDSSSLPIGIIQNISFDKFTYKISESDIVLMVSDGVLLSGEEWIESELKLCQHKSTQDIADTILREAKRRVGNSHSDDMTVVAVKITKG